MYNQMKSIFSSCDVYDNNKVAPTENIVKYITEENDKVKKVKDIYIYIDMYKKIKSISSSFVVYDNSKYSPTDNLKNKVKSMSKIGIYIMVSQNMFVPQLLYNLLVTYILYKFI